MQNPNFYPQSPYPSGFEHADPWASSAPPNSSSIPAPTGRLDQNGFWPNTSPDGWGAPGVESYGDSTAERQGRIAGVAQRIGSLVTREGLGQLLGPGGSAAQGIDRAYSVIDQAHDMSDTRSAKMAERLPLVGRYIKAGRHVIDLIKRTSEITREFNYDTIARGAQRAISNPHETIADARGYATGVAADMKNAALTGAGEYLRSEFGVEREDGRTKVKALKLGRTALSLVTPGSGALLELTSGAASSAAKSALDTLQQHLADAPRAMYDNFAASGSGLPSQETFDPWGYSRNQPPTVGTPLAYNMSPNISPAHPGVDAWVYPVGR